MFKWTRRIVFLTLYLLIAGVLTSFLLLQFKSTQQRLLTFYTSKFSKVLGFEITYHDFYLWWYDHLEINGLKIVDAEKNTMIAIDQLTVNFNVTSLLDNKNVNIDGVSLKSAFVNLVPIQATDSTKDLNINIFIERINEATASQSGTGQPPKVNIGEIVLTKSQFIYNNTEKDSITNGFDYNHFKMNIGDGEVENFKVIGDTIQMNILSLDALHTVTGLNIRQLKTFLMVSQKSMQFLDLHLKTEKSLVQDTIILSYQSLADLSDFNNQVTIKAKFHDTTIDPDDLALFTYSNTSLPQPIRVSGNLNGKISKLTFQKLNLAIGNSQINGNLHMDGLPAFRETFIDLNIKDGRMNAKDIQFLFPENIFRRIAPLGNFKVNGKFTGFVDDFVANGTLDGTLGHVQSDINLKINEKAVEESNFSGSLALKNFNLGMYFNDTLRFQKVSLNGKIKGKGLTLETTDFYLGGRIESIGLMGYNYTNINTDARFAAQLFSGNIQIQDPNLKFKGEGFVDIRKGKEHVNLKARLDSAQFHKLKLIKDELFVQTDLEINTQGLTLDEILGEVLFKNTLVRYKNQSLRFDSVHVISTLLQEGRSFLVRSSFADLKLEGNFYYSTLFKDFERLFHELKLNVRNDKQALEAYYASKEKSIQEYEAKFKITLHDISPLLVLGGLDVNVSKGARIDGKFSNGFTSRLNAFTEIDTVEYQGKYFINNEIEFSGSKVRDSTNVLAILTVNSGNQIIAKNFSTKNLFAEGIWDQDHIDFNMDVDQDGANNYLRLQSEIDFLEDSIKFKVLPTKIKVLEKEWIVNQKNYSLIKGKEISIRHLEVHHNEESIFLEGEISELASRAATLKISNLDLNVLNSISTEKFSGILSGFVEARDLYHNPYLQNKISVSSLTVNDFLIGDISGSNSWNREEKRFNIDFFIDRLNQRTVSLKGFYDPGKPNPLSIEARLEKTNVKIAEPFLKGIFSQMDGELSGDYTITGTFTQPLIRGEGKIEGGKVLIDYLKTSYTFSGLLGFTPNQIIFKEFDLVDAFKSRASLDGYLAHKNFSKFRINLDATFRNFQILNTTPKDNSLFYGQAYGTGKLNMFGPLANMKISATARSEKNTRIFIPISGSESVEKKDFISFINLKDTVKLNSLAKKKLADNEPSGMTMDFNLDITPDAYAEIIFDIKAGDIIRGYGNGDIKLQLDTKGEFNMFGLYEFERGNYNFTLYDIINKEFSINKGSRISWFGDPYTGVLNLSASYRQLATLGPILSDQSVVTAPQIKRKYPVEVLLKLDGPMLSPQINFDLAAKDLPDNVAIEGKAPVRLNFEFNAFKAKLDEQELKRQVFSLIVLRRFSPPDAFSTSGSLYNSVSELLSNQLSYWLTQVDQNLEIDLDLGTLDQEAFNTFQLRLSYSFLNGRLRVTRDGTFSNQYNRSDVANMLGDWTVDYLLTQDGKFKVKMYNRSNLNQLNNSLGNQAAITTGVSLLHTQNFNHWKDLITFARDRRRKELEEEENKEEPQKDGTK